MGWDSEHGSVPDQVKYDPSISRIQVAEGGITEWHPKSNKSQHNGKHWYLKGGSLEILNMSSSVTGMGSGMESYRSSGCHAVFLSCNSAVELMLHVHSLCAINTACIYFMQEQSHISQLQYSMASTDAASHLKLFALFLLQNKEVIFFTVYEWGTKSQDTEDLNSKNKDWSPHHHL